MSNIFKYYKNIFKLFLFNSFNEHAYSEARSAIEKAVDSEEYINATEWKKLKSKYLKKNPEEFKKALAEVNPSVESTVYKEVEKLISEWNSKVDSTTQKTRDNLSNHRESLSSIFTRKLKRGAKGEDVRRLQEYLNSQGYDTNGIEGTFGSGTERALKKFQKEVLGFRHPDGVMDLNGKTMRYIIKHINKENLISNYSKNRKKGDKLYGKEANDVVNALNDTKKFIDAFNHVYGGQGDIISRDNGLLGIVARLGGSSLSRLERELQPNFNKIDKEKLSRVLGIPQNSSRFKEGLIRTATIALISAIISGGSSIALELFGINYGHNYKPGPEINKILRALGRGNINMKKELQEALVSKDTTVEGVEAMYRAMKGLDKDNLKRFINEVYQPNWFQRTFGIFLPDGYEDVQHLVKKFNKTGRLKDAYEVVKAIYKNAHEAVRNARKGYEEALRDYYVAEKVYKEKKSDPGFILSTRKEEIEKDYEDSKYRLGRAKRDLAQAEQGLGKLGEITSRYTNLHEKKYQIRGVRLDIKRARAEERKIDKELSRLYGNRRLRKVSERLLSRQSYGFRVDINRVQDPNYMGKLLTKMNKETINGKTSILAGVIRGVREHYGIDVDVQEFTNAFMNNAEKVDKNEEIYIASNTGRDRLQKFQGTIGNGELFKVYINGQYVYFKDKCTNVVTVVHDIPTTIDYASSVPVVVALKTGHHSGSSNESHSTPGEDRGGSNGGGGGTPSHEGHGR